MLLRPSHVRSALSALVLPALAASCGGGPIAPTPAAPAYDPAGQTKCGVTKSQARPLIVEWPSADRLDLEAQARKGLVAVRYIGCEMEVLRHCQAPGKYTYTATTRQDDHVRIRDEDELYANIPVYAAKFEAALRKAGELDVDMSLVGKFEADRYAVRGDELTGDCARATHVVTSMTAGAFEFYAGASAGASAGAGVLGAGAGVKSGGEREMLNRAGDRRTCDRATRADKEPPDGCGALLRVEVVALAPAAGAATAAGPTPGAAAPAAPAAPAAAAVREQQATRTPQAASAGRGDCAAGMAWVPGGSMVLSHAAPAIQRHLLADAPAPASSKRTRVEGFCMDVSEISAALYGACVKEGRCDAEGLSCGPDSTYGVSARSDRPINCVDFNQASTYCQARGKRLPTEEEWEWAARGGMEALRYPWGMEYNSGNTRFCVERLCGVTFAQGDSAHGIHNLIGNVWEWTTTTTASSERVLRGGGYVNMPPENITVRTSRSSLAPAGRRLDVGFRCAR